MRISNRDCRVHVQNRVEFVNNNDTIEAYDTASTTGTDLYVVNSYGAHFPMYIAEELDGVVNWYGNEGSHSRTTSTHQSLCHPHVDNIMWFRSNDMLVLAKHGITGLAAGKIVRVVT